VSNPQQRRGRSDGLCRGRSRALPARLSIGRFVIADQAGVVPGRRVKVVVSGGYGPNETDANTGIITAQNAPGKAGVAYRQPISGI